MISLIIDLTLFFLVLFVVMPGMMIFAMLMRDVIYQNRKHAGRHKELAGKAAGW